MLQPGNSGLSRNPERFRFNRRQKIADVTSAEYWKIMLEQSPAMLTFLSCWEVQMTKSVSNWNRQQICVAGAGAVGLTLTARLMLGGYNVGLIARGESIGHIRKHGVTLVDGQGEHRVFPEVASAEGFREASHLFLCPKSQDMPHLAASVRHLISPETVVIPVINGLPWWYFDGEGGAWEGSLISAVDPEGRLKKIIPSRQVIGTTTVMTAERIDRGTVHAFNPLAMVVGELDDSNTPRLEATVTVLERSSITTRIAHRIRDAIWTKVVRNLISNPLTAITGATLSENFQDQYLADTSRQMLQEILPVLASYGAQLETSPEAILDLGKKMGNVKTSMLQDVERGNPLELAAICDAVLELAGRQSLQMPVTRAISNIAHFKGSRANRTLAA